jgi:hypothetical protein
MNRVVIALLMLMALVVGGVVYFNHIDRQNTDEVYYKLYGVRRPTTADPGTGEIARDLTSAIATTIGGFILLSLVTLIYFAPSIIADRKHKRNVAAIFIVNIFLGWTFIGWVVCLAWSLTVEHQSK